MREKDSLTETVTVEMNENRTCVIIVVIVSVKLEFYQHCKRITVYPHNRERWRWSLAHTMHRLFTFTASNLNPRPMRFTEMLCSTSKIILGAVHTEHIFCCLKARCLYNSTQLQCCSNDEWEITQGLKIHLKNTVLMCEMLKNLQDLVKNAHVMHIYIENQLENQHSGTQHTFSVIQLVICWQCYRLTYCKVHYHNIC